MFYTHETRTDGFGAQYQGIITTILYCKEHNLNYIYSPLQYVEHNYENDTNYKYKLENLMNLKDNIKTDCLTSPRELLFGNIRQMFESNIDHYCNSDAMKLIKDCFWLNKERDHFQNNKINIAVQIRRENSHDNRNAGDRASTPNTYYKKIMNKIRDEYTDTEILFHIYSQGQAESFHELVGGDTQFHLNEEITSTFIGMVAADILILSPSSFSYVAGLLSDGKVYYKNFWHHKKKEWVLCG
jgi:hypothetical protein